MMFKIYNYESLILTSCLFTGSGRKQWLKVTFAGLAKVEKVQIFNRRGKAVDYRINGAEITLWSEDTQVKSCGTLSYSTTESFPSQSYLINCGSDQLADTVKIEQRTEDFLNLMEVYVLTKAAPQHALKCSESEYIAGRKYMKCPILAGGLAVGDVVSALVFFEHGEGFILRLVGTQVKCILIQLKYREAMRWIINKRGAEPGSWGVGTKPSGSILPHKILLAIKMTVTADSYTATVNGEALAPLPHEGNFKQIRDVDVRLETTTDDPNATLFSMSFNAIQRGEYHKLV